MDGLRALGLDRHHLRLLAVIANRNLLEIQNQIGDVVDDAGERAELVQSSVDLDRRNRRSFDRRQQAAPKRIADRRAKAPLERLGQELAVGFVQRVELNLDALGALKVLPKHFHSLYANPSGRFGAGATEPDFVRTPTQTRRRLRGRQPLCGIGVTSLIDLIESPVAWSERTADSRPPPGPLTSTSTERTPRSLA